MKLEMTAYDMAISVDLSDDDTFNVSLDVVQTIRNLVEELRSFSNVNVSITSILVDDYATESDDEIVEDNSMPPTISMEQINAQASWPVPNSDVTIESAQEEVVTVGLPLMSPIDEDFESQVQYIAEAEANVFEDSTTKQNNI